MSRVVTTPMLATWLAKLASLLLKKVLSLVKKVLSLAILSLKAIATAMLATAKAMLLSKAKIRMTMALMPRAKKASQLKALALLKAKAARATLAGLKKTSIRQCVRSLSRLHKRTALCKSALLICQLLICLRLCFLLASCMRHWLNILLMIVKKSVKRLGTKETSPWSCQWSKSSN